MEKKVIVTGCQGFIGFHLCCKLLKLGWEVTGVDISYSGITLWPEDSDPVMMKLKTDRLRILKSFRYFTFLNTSISKVKDIEGPISVINLAARAGIPFSKEKPLFYECDNVLNFAKLIFNLRNTKIENFVYASSSSVYGGNDTPTGCTETMKLNPLNVYANTKMYNEYQAGIYGKLYNIPFSGLRFFTVMGTYGRIDQSIYKWTKAILNDEPVILNNNGDMWRDFTPVDNIVQGIILALQKPQEYKIYNLGNGVAYKISDIVKLIETYTDKKAIIENRPYPEGEVYKSLSNIELAHKELGYKPTVSFEDCLKNYVEWYTDYFKL